MMETSEAGPGTTARSREPEAVFDSSNLQPAAKRTDSKPTPTALQPTTTDVPPLKISAALQQHPMSAEQIQHEQAAALLVFDAARQRAQEEADDALLDYEGEQDGLSPDEEDPWSPDSVAPDIFDAADAEENPDLLDIQSAESKVASCIYEFTASAIPDPGLKLTPGKKQTFADAPVFKFALVDAVQRMSCADTRCTIVVSDGRKENRKGGICVSAFFFNIALSTQHNTDLMMAAITKQQGERKFLKLMRYTVRFERKPIVHEGIRFHMDRITVKSGPVPTLVQILNCCFDAGLEPGAVLHAEEATLPGKGVCPVFSGKLVLYLKPEYCTDHGTDTVDEAGLPTHSILCPPPSVLVKDSTGFRHHRQIRRTGTCPFCLGRHKGSVRDCPYKGICRACLWRFKSLVHEGNKHCCGLGVEGLPREDRNTTHGPVAPVQIQPGSRAAKRRRRQQDNIAKMGRQDMQDDL